MPTAEDHLLEIRELLRETPLIDGHNDLPWQFFHRKKTLADIDLAVESRSLNPPLVTDIPRLRAGGIGAQFWAIYVPPRPPGPSVIRAALQEIELVHEWAERYPETFELAATAEDIERIHRHGKIASLIGIEGGHCIDNSLAILRILHRLGARYLTLTHVQNNDWADAAGDNPRHHGLTAFGEQVIRELNRLGMMVDLSHVSDDTMRAALRVSQAPVIFSHSSARSVCNHPRNVPDDILRDVRDNGGMVMVCFLPGYLNQPAAEHWRLATAEQKRVEALYPNDAEKVERGRQEWCRAHPFPPASLIDVANHIDHIRNTIGIDHVGMGSDFEGYFGTVTGLEDVSCYPALFLELRRRGYSTQELRHLAGENLLRVLRQVEQVASKLKNKVPPP